MNPATLDTVVCAETPEGIVIELRPAGLAARLCAFLIDWLIRGGVLYGLALVLLFSGMMASGISQALMLILLFAMVWLYPIPFELSRWGATPGKRVLGLKVVMDSGLPITPGASVTRNLLHFADFLPFLYAFGATSMLVRRDFKRLGDIAAGTLVVYRPLPAPPAMLESVEPMAPVRHLNPQGRAAVIALAARAPRLTGERLDELAALAAAVSGDTGRSGPEVTRRVLAVAQWLLGRR